MSSSLERNGKEHEPDGQLGETLRLISMLLTATRLPDKPEISTYLYGLPEFQALYNHILDLRTLSRALSRGDLQEFVYSKGFVISNLKALQSNLRHLTWQTKKVAEGDFTQRVDFLGDFSDSFNEMTIRLSNSQEQMKRLASVDVLTQVANRLTLEQFLKASFADATRNNTPLSILMFDIDHFKQVNDTFGHGVGDQVLVQVSELLSRQFRASDIFARYGGEEFVAVLPGLGLEAAARVAERTLTAVRNLGIDLEDRPPLHITVSVGVSSRRPEDGAYTDIISRSDAALYKAKGSGRNQVCTE